MDAVASDLASTIPQPLDVGSQVIASDRAVACPLDVGQPGKRDAAAAPFRDRGRPDFTHRRDDGSSAEGLDDGVVRVDTTNLLVGLHGDQS